MKAPAHDLLLIVFSATGRTNTQNLTPRPPHGAFVQVDWPQLHYEECLAESNCILGSLVGGHRLVVEPELELVEEVKTR